MSIEFTLYCDLCYTAIETTFVFEELEQIVNAPGIAKRRYIDPQTGEIIDRCPQCFKENRTEKK